MFPYLNHAIVVTTHAIDALACFSKDKFIDTIVANFALETMSMIRVVSCHDSLIENRQTTNIATVRTVGTDGRTIRKQKQVGVGGDLVSTLCALEAVDMKEGLTVSKNIR